MVLVDRNLKSDRAAFERRILAVLAVLVGLAAFFTARLVFAQDPAAPAEPSLDVSQLATIAHDAIAKGHWGLLVAVVLVFLVWAVRKFGGRFDKLKPVINHPVVAWALPTLASVGGMAVTTLAAGKPLSLALFMQALVEGLAAVGVFIGAKKVQEAAAAGKAAAGAVDTKPEALAGLSLVPPGVAPITAEEKAAALERLK